MTDVTTYDRQLRVEPALSWSGIIAGSLVAVASSVFLTTLASGFGYDVAAGALASRRSLDAFTPELAPPPSPSRSSPPDWVATWLDG